MTRKATIIFLLLFVSKLSVNGQGAWIAKADFGGGISNWATGFSIGTKGYIGTGVDSTVTDVNTFWEYDPSNNTWTQKANFAGAPRRGAMSFSIGNKGYLGTGKGTSLLNDFWEYDPAINTWTQLGNFPGVPRIAARGFSIGSKGYLATGDTSAGFAKYTNEFWEYNPTTDTWLQLTFPGIARAPGVIFSIGSKGYFGCGNDLSDYPLKDWWEFDPTTNTWAQKADMPSGRCAAAGFAIGMKGYVGTGQDSTGNNTKSFWEFDPSVNLWTVKPDFGGQARHHAVGFSIGTKGFLGTGSFTKDFWEYDPQAVGVYEIEILNRIHVSPNPFNNITTIEVQLNSTSYDLCIYDSQGRMVRFIEKISDQRYELHRGNLPSGMYYYMVKGANVSMSGKLIVQ